jgi:hypothetical protein
MNRRVRHVRRGEQVRRCPHVKLASSGGTRSRGLAKLRWKNLVVAGVKVVPSAMRRSLTARLEALRETAGQQIVAVARGK